MSVEQFKLVCIDSTNFTDEQVALLIPSIHMTTDQEVTEYVRILKTYRPNLAKTFLANDQF